MINLQEIMAIAYNPDFADVEKHRAYLRNPNSEDAIRNSTDLALRLNLLFEPELVTIWEANHLARCVGVDYGCGLAFIGRTEDESTVMAEFYYGPGKSPPLFDAIFGRPKVDLNFDRPVIRLPPRLRLVE